MVGMIARHRDAYIAAGVTSGRPFTAAHCAAVNGFRKRDRAKNIAADVDRLLQTWAELGMDRQVADVPGPPQAGWRELDAIIAISELFQASRSFKFNPGMGR